MKKQFEIFDRFFGAHWFLTGYSCRYFSELLQEGGNRSITEFIGIMENDVNSMVFDTEQFNKAGNYYANKLINDRKWRGVMYRRHHKDGILSNFRCYFNNISSIIFRLISWFKPRCNLVNSFK